MRAAGRGERAHALERFLEIYDQRLLNHTRLYDGIADVVRQARTHARLTVLTNKPIAPSERILAALGLRDAFDEVVGGDGPFPRKPDPAALTAMMTSAGATAADTLLVGDSADRPRDGATRGSGVLSGLVRLWIPTGTADRRT